MELIQKAYFAINKEHLMSTHSSMKLIMLLVLLGFTHLVHAQYINYTEKSKEYYTLGIDAYKQKKYVIAKDFFEKCYNEDIASLGENDDRIYHSLMWYARCLYLMGEEKDALDLSRWCSVEPIDREKTIESDSLSHIASKYLKDGNIQKALDTALLYAEIEHKECGDCYWYANSLTTIAGYYIQLNELEQSLKYNQQALALRKKIFGEMHIDCFTSLRNIADIISFQGNYKDAAKYYVDATKILYYYFPTDNNINIICDKIYNCLNKMENTKVESNNLDKYISSNLPISISYNLFNNLKMTKFQQYNYQDAEYYAKTIWDLYNGNNDDNELLAIAEYGSILKNNGKYTDALSVLTMIVQKFKNTNYNKSAIYAASIRELSEAHHSLGNKTKAYEYGKEAVSLFKTINDSTNNNVSIKELSWALRQQSVYNNGIGKFNEAKSTIEESISLLCDNKDIINDYNSRIARNLIVKAKILCDSGEYNQSFDVITECMAMIKNDTLCTVFDYANSLDVYVDILCRKGNTQEAISACDEFISIIKSTNGIDNGRYLNAIEKKASIYTLTGDYANAELLHEQAVSIANKIYGCENPMYAYIMNNMSICKYSLGDIRGALEISNELCKIKTLQEKGNEGIAMQVMYQKAIYEMNFEMSNLAIEDFQFSLDLLESLDVDDFPDLYTYKASILSNMACAYHVSGNTKDAKNSINTAKKVLEDNKLDNTLTYAEITVYRKYINGIDDNNAALLHKAQSVISNLLGKNNIMYLNSTTALVDTYIESENVDSVEVYAEHCYNEIVNIMENNKLHLTNSLRNTFWNNYNSYFSNEIPRIASEFRTPRLCSLAYNSSLYNKGFLLNSYNTIKNTILNTKDSLLINHYNNYIRIQNALAYELDNKNDLRYKNLRNELVTEENYLLNKCSQIKQAIIHTYKWEDVQKHLDEKDLAVEILSYSKGEDIEYSAFCIDKECPNPFVISLFKESAIDSVINKYGTVSQEAVSYLTHFFQDAFHKYKNVFYSPTGKIQFIPIENFMEDCTIYRVSSTKQICTRDDKEIVNVSLYGGINYDTIISSETNDNKTNPIYNQNSSLDNIERSHVEYLPGTLVEINEISETLKNAGVEVTKYIDEYGTESSFRSMSGNSSSIIHLATHGKYIQIEDVEKIKESQNLSFLITKYDTNTIPFDEVLLSHSYLVFAGGNTLSQKKDFSNENENGILTALEASQLDLRNTDLLTLSACQSGLGDSYDEGVIGLQYGFKRAGVKSILMSLDNVDDKATQLLMVEFYKNLLSGKSKHDSLRDAQRYLRTTENGKYSDPKYWASFIMLDGI